MNTLITLKISTLVLIGLGIFCTASLITFSVTRATLPTNTLTHCPAPNNLPPQAPTNYKPYKANFNQKSMKDF